MTSPPRSLIPVLAALGLAAACALGQGAADPRAGVNSFIRTSAPVTELDPEARAVFLAGRDVFAKRWTQAEGLGPLFDGQSCVICHPRGGHGRPVSADRPPADNASMIVRFPPGSAYGAQLQRRGPDGAGEGQLSVSWTETPFVFPDGEMASLRAPHFALTDLALGAAPESFSVVIALKLAGAAQLDAVPADQILALADPEDLDGDGISGRAAILADGRLGRFGWRAEAATLGDQAARAFALDMGLSTHTYPDPNGGAPAAAPEVSSQAFAELMTFLRMMEPPVPAAPGRTARRGEALFTSLGCASCHHPSFVTGEAPEAQNAFREIEPYTDLLLHDMGPGLADGISSEWRTAPLWGAALRRQVHGEEFYLHDGRARSLTEAILWHGGEASGAQARFTALSAKDRAALIAFLETL